MYKTNIFKHNHLIIDTIIARNSAYHENHIAYIWQVRGMNQLLDNLPRRKIAFKPHGSCGTKFATHFTANLWTNDLKNS